ERLAKSLEMEAFGSAPEVINYMVMSMELSPSLDRAVLFAAENAEGPMADELKSLVWKVQAREFSTIEDALMSYAGELESSNEELRSAIYNILSASKESEHDKMRASLRRASESVMTGTKQRVEGFAASLSTPATVLFSLGILLPMIIGSMLPMLSMGGLGMAPQPVPVREESWVPTLVLSVLVMNMAFPIIALVYSNFILAKRPGMHTVYRAANASLRDKMPVSAVIIAGFAGLGYMVGAHLEFWGMEWAIAALLGIFGLAVGAWHALAWGMHVGKMKSIEKLEDRMPDMLFQLGSRLGEGLALERAVEDVARTMADTEMGDFLADALARLRRSGAGFSAVLFSRDIGILNDHPSRKLKAAMRLVVEAASKDPEMAGSILITMSNHMRELANSDKDMRLKLRSTIDSMKNTAILFAPVIMGVTVGLYALLSETFGEMNGAETMPAPYFIMVIGVYLLMTVAIIMYFCSGIEHGRGRWKRDTGIALPVAAIIFCVCSLGALLAFG
ncbi:MAG: type II secretion system F family protein, partial [Thermoplasmata archaeon]